MGLYRSIAHIEATQFTSWSDAVKIMDWLNYKGVYFVPRGYDHKLRNTNEYADDGNSLSSAPEFLVVKTSTDFEPLNRADLGDWILLDGRGDVSICKRDVFFELYEKVEN